MPKQKSLNTTQEWVRYHSVHLQRSVPIPSLLKGEKLSRHSLSHSGFLVPDACIRTRGVSAWKTQQ